MRIVLVLAFWLLLAGTANAQTVSVTRTDDPATGTCQPTDCSLRQAIAAAETGGTVQLMGSVGNPQVHQLTRGQLVINRDLTIQGGGSAVSRIDGLHNNGDRIMKVDDAEVTIADLTFQNAFQSRDEITSSNPLNHNGGGALYAVDGETTINRVGFESNYSTVMPAGALSTQRGTLAVDQVDFNGNYSYAGSALFVRSGNVTVNRSTIRDNTNTRGSVYLAGDTLQITNSTVTGNGFPSNAGGGVVNAGGTLTLASDTLADNLRGSLMTYDNATTRATNTVIGAGFHEACVLETEPGAPEAAPAVTVDLGHNYAADDSCELSDLSSHNSANLRFAPIADNAGRTPTMALLWGSDAIEGGGICPPADQRDITRQGTCDAGAFEAQRFGVPEATTVEPPTQIQARQATVAADFNLFGEAGALRVDYGLQEDDLTFTTIVGVGVSAGTTRRTAVLQGLEPETKYYYQAFVFNATGVAVGEKRSFTTGPEGPAVGGIEVFGTTDTGASVTTTVNPNGHATSYIVKWTSANGSSQIGPFDVGSGTSSVSITKEITGLKPGTAYLVDVLATSVGGTTGSYSPGEFTTRPQITGRVGSTVTLTDGGAGCPLSASVDWGDQPRQEVVPVDCGPDRYSINVTHTYATAGRFHISIAYENFGMSDAWAEIKPLATLSVSRSGPGRVTGAGIDCGGDCSEAAAGAITLTATPDPGAKFDGWDGACSGTGPCTVTLDDDRSVTARFSAVVQAQPSPTPTATPTPAPEQPVAGKTVVVVPTGTVLVKLKGSKTFVVLKPGSVPLGAQIDVTKGSVELTSVPKPGAPPETAKFYGGIFTVTQSGGVTILKLSGPEPTCKAKASAGKKVKTRKLWGDGKGSFRTSGKYSAATVRGTRWLVEDSCSGTLTQVKVGVVSVRDNVTGKTITLRAGKKYLARPRRR